MSESTLTLGLDDYIAKVGTFLGWGRGSVFGDPAYNSFQQATLDDCVASGIRQFYFPPPLQGEPTAYEWSFLRPVATVELPTGSHSIQMPDDFGGFEGQITIQNTTNSIPWPINLTSEGRIRQMFSQLPASSGRPMWAGLEPLKGTTQLASNRYRLNFFPISDGDYTLQFQYYILPDYLTGNNPYVYGGASHVETILESCLAIAEQRVDDMAGVHTAKFQERLAASISMDKKSKPQTWGRNRDRSDENEWTRRNLHYFPPLATYNGNSFD